MLVSYHVTLLLRKIYHSRQSC